MSERWMSRRVPSLDTWLWPGRASRAIISLACGCAAVAAGTAAAWLTDTSLWWVRVTVGLMVSAALAILTGLWADDLLQRKHPPRSARTNLSLAPERNQDIRRRP
jgi:hypothetical protein